jgi:hypothetical protein
MNGRNGRNGANGRNGRNGMHGKNRIAIPPIHPIPPIPVIRERQKFRATGTVYKSASVSASTTVPASLLLRG